MATFRLKHIRMQDATSKEERFQILAVKAFEGSVGRRGLKDTEYYFFYDGIKILDDGEVVAIDWSANDYQEVFNDYLLEQSRKVSATKTVPHVSISSVVGKNGSGKSTVVEFVIRLINNYAAILFGEQLVGYSHEHLHYINGLDGELFFLAGDKVYRLKVKDRAVRLDPYELDEDDTEDRADKYRIKPDDKHLGEISVSDGPILEQMAIASVMKPYLADFFYTVVSNYSIYAYNTLDYQEENNDLVYEEKISDEGQKGETKPKQVKIDSSMCNWLHGIFHKNDGYKTPLVLTPYRDKGIININVENTLSRERFISMLLMSYGEEGGFKRINGHLDVEHFEIHLKGDYGREYINRNLDINPLGDQEYTDIKIQILHAWSDKLLREMETLDEHADDKLFVAEALNYIVYKTIKIATKYDDYKKWLSTFEEYESEVDSTIELSGEIDEYVDNLKDDRSHITRKLRQALAYLLTDSRYDVYTKHSGQLEVKKVAEKAQNAVKQIIKTYGYDSYVREIEDMIPPAFLDTKMLLKEVGSDNTEPISFETLSSGEKQQIFSVCSLLYHLLNINSVKEDLVHNRFSYNYVNLILEEIELYFHPDFQKQYITMILDGIAQLDLKNIYGINICFVTHSPFILSDVPKRNLLILKDGKAVKSEYLRTFGANIYDMLKNSFFLEGTPIGSYAQWVITRIIIALSVWKYLNEADSVVSYEDLLTHVKNRDVDESKYEFLRRYFGNSNRMDRTDFESDYSGMKLWNRIMAIDELFVRESLVRAYYDAFPKEFNRQREIAELERRLEALRNYEED